MSSGQRNDEEVDYGKEVLRRIEEEPSVASGSADHVLAIKDEQSGASSQLQFSDQTLAVTDVQFGASGQAQFSDYTPLLMQMIADGQAQEGDQQAAATPSGGGTPRLDEGLPGSRPSTPTRRP